MKEKLHDFFIKIKQKIRSTVDLVSVILVFLFPVVTGTVFFRLMCMTGVPVWFYILQGLFFTASLAQAIYFLSAVLIRTVRSKKAR